MTLTRTVRVSFCAGALAIGALASTPAFAQLSVDELSNIKPETTKSNSWSSQTLTRPVTTAANISALVPALPDQSRVDAVLGATPVLRDALFGLPNDNSAPVFALDLNGSLCLRTTSECDANGVQRVDVNYSRDFAAAGIKNIDLALTPRAGVKVDDDRSSALVGGLVKIGDNLRADSEVDSNTWYFFAGADAQAVTFVPGQENRFYSGDFHLQDRIIVGDAQAGVSYRLGEADLSLTYLRREGKAENYKYKEDAAALSLTWRR